MQERDSRGVYAAGGQKNQTDRSRVGRAVAAHRLNATRAKRPTPLKKTTDPNAPARATNPTDVAERDPARGRIAATPSHHLGLTNVNRAFYLKQRRMPQKVASGGACSAAVNASVNEIRVKVGEITRFP